MLIRRNYFHENRFLLFLYAPLHCQYDLAYRNNDFFSQLQQCVGSFFCFLLLEIDGDLPSLLIGVLKTLVVSN